MWPHLALQPFLVFALLLWDHVSCAEGLLHIARSSDRVIWVPPIHTGWKSSPELRDAQALSRTRLRCDDIFKTQRWHAYRWRLGRLEGSYTTQGPGLGTFISLRLCRLALCFRLDAQSVPSPHTPSFSHRFLRFSLDTKICSSSAV